MPFNLMNILELCGNDRKEAVTYCLSVATNFPAFREEYEGYARLLMSHSK